MHEGVFRIQGRQSEDIVEARAIVVVFSGHGVHTASPI
jgi:hypothetical protein